MVAVLRNVLTEVNVPQVGEVIIEVGSEKALVFADRVTPPVKNYGSGTLILLTYVGWDLG